MKLMELDDLKKVVGNRLRRLREAQGINQGEFATKIDISQQALNSYENGRRMPAMNYLVALADEYGCSVDWLLGREEKTGCLGGPLTVISEGEIQYIQNVISQISTSIHHTENHLDTLQRFVGTLNTQKGGKSSGDSQEQV